MKALQITLFIIANVVFITQGGRDIHQLVWGTEASVLDQFDPAMTKARTEKNFDALVKDYQSVNDQIQTLEKGKDSKGVQDIRQENNELYDKKEALRSEISERESKRKEFRDLWIFAAFGAGLVIAGGFLCRSQILWPGMSLLIAGFSVFEYWISPSFFSGANTEFHTLLVSKTLLTFVALISLYILWCLRKEA